MNSKNQRRITAALLCGACLLTASSQAKDVFLRAAPTTTTMPDGRVVPMWGFAEDVTAFGAEGTLTVPGPAIKVAPTDPVLRIALDNRLSEAVSLVIPGLPPPTVLVGGPTGSPLAGHTRFTPAGDTRERARSFVPETPAGNLIGGVQQQVWYVWNNVPPGTYLYHSGSHVALQVQMGLYGAVTKLADANLAYVGHPVNEALDITLLFSEVDADLHDAVASGQYGPGLQVPSTIHSKPQYYLINGKAYYWDPVNPAPPIVLTARPTAGLPALIRFLNAGQDGRVPIINQSELVLIAQDAQLNAYPRTQYSIQLPALKTVDAVWTQLQPGTFAVYDRALGLSNKQQSPGGMLVNLQVP